ncbi:MAG TPA: GMC family oxidoreductase [Candidatus Dormibacteraeota bacterium]|nr:GMC family oxidoreductase [Candidatus Dormibacteraeota bacterium]
MIADRHHDVIIIGTGAGGGTLAYHLAASGKRILLLERGDWLPREKANWDSRAVFVENRYHAQETWYDASGRPIHPGIHYYVGGNTKVYGAVLFRLRKEDFGEIRHHGGVSPAWPVPYEEFEPYYAQAERLYQVHGRHGVDPTDPPASSDYPYPPVSHESRIQQLSDQLERAGYHPFPLPVGVLLDERHGRPTHASRCIRCDTFDGFPCLVNGKSDAQILCVEPALGHANVQLETRAFVKRLQTDASGREVTGVVVDHDGAVETYSSDVVVVACGAINSAALLLRSAGGRHPDGLANGSGVVGRHYMRHNNSAVMAVSREPNPTVFQKTLGINDFYFGSDDWGYPLGHIQTLGKSDGEMLKGEAPAWAVWKPNMPLDTMARHALDFWLTSEDLPDPDNRVTLNARGEIVLHLKETNMEGHRRLLATLKAMLGHLGCEAHLLPRSLYLGKQVPIGGTAHQCGTVRFGRDPTTSALDVDCRAHELDNLYVVDGSFFPSSGAVNPALTIMANALRVGDHLLERLGTTRRVAQTTPSA